MRQHHQESLWTTFKIVRNGRDKSSKKQIEGAKRKQKIYFACISEENLDKKKLKSKLVFSLNHKS